MYFLITVYTNKLTKTFCKLKQITVIDLFETAKLLLSIYLFLVLKKLRPTFLERFWVKTQGLTLEHSVLLKVFDWWQYHYHIIRQYDHKFTLLIIFFNFTTKSYKTHFSLKFLRNIFHIKLTILSWQIRRLPILYSLLICYDHSGI